MTKNAACYWSRDHRVCRWSIFIAIQLLFWVASRAPTTEAFGFFWKTAAAETRSGPHSQQQQQQQQQPRTVARTKPERMHHLQAAQDAAGAQPDSQPPPKYPRAAVAVAVRCLCSDSDSNQPEARYLLIRRGNEPNKGAWAIPGGKLEWGETTLEGAKRELAEEVVFVDADNVFNKNKNSGDNTNHWELAWSPHPYTATDAIFGDRFHYLIAVCFAECRRRVTVGGREDGTQLLMPPPPSVAAADDATDARWWSLRELAAAIDNGNDPDLANSLPEGSLTPGLVERLQRTERLYQAEVLL